MKSNAPSRKSPKSFKSLALATLLFAIAACARPNYLNQGPASVATAKSAQTTQCDATFANEKFCVQFAWEKLPTETAQGTMIVKLVRPNLADASPVPTDLASHQTLQVELWMPSMGHGSTPITVTPLDIGSFRASEVFFIMRGAWEIHFNVMDGDTKVDSAAVSTSF